ncbi:MAG: D-tyrosyl-tRNA(Tyr) deacylase [Candidatus Cloacimonetes bacterium]|nr:D-tyrosyl-tRNA(Tyr) deacylase [Candidatus Cloacimonadota bacterium]
MIAVLQRVSKASVTVNEKVVGAIEGGFLVLLGVAQEDSQKDLDYIVKKVSNMRVFEDDNEKMNLNLSQVNGKLLLVSQFTLLACTKKGNRPSFNVAAEPKMANEYYEKAITAFEAQGLEVQTGQFGAKMQISLINEGPVTIILDSKKV